MSPRGSQLVLGLVLTGCALVHAYPEPTAEVCDNDRDDDFDGLVDCLDVDCASVCEGSGRPLVAEVSVGDQHACALTSRGEVYCWGSSAQGRLGLGTLETTTGPTRLDLDSVVGVDAGVGGACALLENGEAWCWGLNDVGQVGAGDSNRVEAAPARVASLGNDVVQIVHGWSNSCARLRTGEVRCWGTGTFGLLGDRTEDAFEPVEVPGMPPATDLWTYGHGCVRALSGDIFCWGGGSSGRLGNGAETHALVPIVPDQIRADTVDLALGALHACSLAANGSVRCWGANRSGAVGVGDPATQLLAVDVAGVGGAIEIAAGAFHTCALRADGAVLCWGENDQGQVGDPSFEDRVAPIPVEPLPPARAISAGLKNTCALTLDGRVFCWGGNDFGQLGAGSGEPSARPTEIILPY